MTAKATKESTTKEKAAKKQKPTNGPDQKAAATKQQAKAQRDAKGQFVKGNKGGPGNPYARQVAHLRYALLFTSTAVDIVRAANALKEKAFAGEVAAIKLFFHYVLGKPTEAIDPDRIAIDEWQKLKEKAIPPEEMAEVMKQCPAQLANNIVNEQWPGEIRRHMDEAHKENEELEAQVAEDMRYLDELDKAEEEALRQKMEALRQKEGFNPRPACDPNSAYLQAAAAGAPVPSPNGETADENATQSPEPKRPTQSPERKRREARPVANAPGSDCAPSLIGAFGIENRLGWLDCAAVLARAEKAARDKALSPPHNRRRPSSNGEKTAIDERR
jgi:hypothetical protein